MFKKRLQWKLSFFVCLVAVCLVIPIGLFLNIHIERYHYNQFIRGIEKGFSAYYFPENQILDAQAVYMEIRDIYSGIFNIAGDNRSYTVLDRKTNRVFSSDYSFLHKDDNMFLDELYRSGNFVRAVAGIPGQADILQTIGGQSFYDYARTVNNLVLYFRYYKADWSVMVGEFNTLILTALLLSLSAAFLIGLVLSKAVTIPIEGITEKTRRIAEGHFDQILEKQGNDEIGELASSINEMSKSLRSMVETISSEKNKLETIMDNMNEGIIAFDKKGEVILVNSMALSMLGRDTLSGSFGEFLRQYGIGTTEDEIVSDIADANGKNHYISREGTIISITFALVMDQEKRPESIILILRDITKQRKLEEMRKDFVANVSHELKTPLTSIKSYSETLLNGMVEDRDTLIRFLQVIDSETERMSNLVRNLLQLSSIDTDQMKLTRNRYQVGAMIQKTVEKLQIEAEKKQQHISVDIAYSGKAAFDYDKIQQVLINLLGNAIKYSEEKGSIQVSCREKEDFVWISVRDEGIGIPEKDLDKVFDRFYRVDKGRSRKMGGTGLGLAIAKEIVSAHRGEIFIQSKLNEGTEVTFTLPLKYMGGET